MPVSPQTKVFGCVDYYNYSGEDSLPLYKVNNQGIPIALKHRYPIAITKSVDSCNKDNDIPFEFDRSKLMAYIKENNLRLATDHGKQFIERDCNVTDQWSVKDDTSCHFTMPLSSITTKSYNDNDAFIQKRFQPTDAKQATLETFTAKWGDQFPRLKRITDKEWRSVYYPRLVQWKDRPSDIILPIHVLINKPTKQPRSIVSYGMEVECGSSECSIDFLDDAHEDNSGPMEITTSGHDVVIPMFKELAQYHYVQTGESEGDNECVYDCGSHIHIAPPYNVQSDDDAEDVDYQLEEEQDRLDLIQYQTYRHLMGYFAPFFAGSTQKNIDFRFRDGVSEWADVPPDYDEDGEPLRSMDNEKSYYVHPHPSDYDKPFTYEFRLNEAIAPSAITAINIMSRIVDGFIDTGYHPRWHKDTLSLAKKSIPKREITDIDELEATLTTDPITKQIIAKITDIPITTTKVSLIHFVDSALANFPLESYEKTWLNRIKNGVTWSTMLSAAKTVPDKIQLTREMNREPLPENIKRMLKKSDHAYSLYDYSSDCECDDELDSLSDKCRTYCLTDCDCDRPCNELQADRDVNESCRDYCYENDLCTQEE